MYETIKNNWQKFGNLYGNETFIIMLKKAYKNVSYCQKTIPYDGSPSTKSERVKEDTNIQKMVFHRNKEITIITEYGNLRFF